MSAEGSPALWKQPERAAGLPAWEAGEGQTSPPGTFSNKGEWEHLIDEFTIPAVKSK